MTRPKIPTTILSLVIALVVAAVAAPLASAGSVPNTDVGDGLLTQGPAAEPSPESQDGILNIDSFDAKFRVDPSYDNDPRWKYVDFDGLMTMNPADAEEFFNGYHVTGRYTIEWRVWGDDPVSDDLLMAPNYSLSIDFRPNGFWFGGHISVYHTILDEDHSRFDNRDEIYGEVRLMDRSTGKVVRSVKTNTVTGYF